MADELVGCICSSLAGLMGAVRDAVAHAQGLSSPTDILPSAADAAGGGGGDQLAAGGGGLSPTHVAALLLLLLALFMSAFGARPALPAKPPRNSGTSSEDDAGPPVA